MRQVIHILRKDLRHLRWLLALWVAILVLRVVLAAIGANTAGETFPAAIVFRELSGLLSVLQTLMLALMVSGLVHAEPLVGWNAFWLTRPYSSGALITAKLLFLTGVLVIAPLLADLATMAIVNAGPRAQLAAAPSFLSSHLWWALALCAIAVLTPSLARFVLTVIGVTVGLAVALLLTLSVAVALGAVQDETIVSPMLPDPTPELISLAVSIAGALAVIVYQYRYRRLRIAVMLAGLVIVAETLVPGWWPWPFLRPAAPDPGAWSHNVEATPVTIDPRMTMYATTRDAFEQSGPRIHQIHAGVTLTGMPADFAVQTVTVRGTLTLPDGKTLRSVRNEGIPGPDDVPDDVNSTARAALGVSAILNEVEERHRVLWPALLAIDEQDYQRYRGQSGRFSATLDFHLLRTRVRGTLPLRAGAVLEDVLARVEVLRATPASGGYKLVVRQWHVRPLTKPGGSEAYEFVLRNRRQRSAVELGRQMSYSGSFSGSSLGSRAISAAMGGFHFVSPSSGFGVQTESLEFPVRIRGGYLALSELDPSWFADAELVALETAYAGTVRRTVRLDDFQIPVK